ncbi:hypothetical protein AVEN_158848-1 [Araneus ventricosus]|uniref:Fibronectin type-III domain-containing protein n=1 Tax=Araneus ventricosus TaxID=182803 RepID=A0A4Y2E5U7_ARAVE|nr:hypothetical protein AVEN_158848-1 [Araneus ventricosus]
MGPPEPIHDCIIANRTAHSLSVECKPGYNGSLTQIFHMEIYNSVAEYMADNVTNIDKPRFKVTGLSPSTSYVLVIYSSNAKGRSKSVALVAATLSPAKRRTAREASVTLNPVLGVFIGVIVVVVIIAVIIITIIKTRRSRSSYQKDTSITDGKFERPLDASWFMQDGARPYRKSAVLDLLKEHFKDRVIALDYDKHTGSDMAWPPYSPDFTPCDFSLGYLKDLVYHQTPQTITELKQYISTACETIPSDMFTWVSGQFCLRLLHVVAANSDYFENIVFNFLQQSLQHFHTGFYFSYYAVSPIAGNGN